MNYRIKQSHICMSDAMRFQQHFEARVDRPIREVLTEELLLDVRTMLKPGDQVILVAYEDSTWACAREIATLRITQVDDQSAEYAVIDNIVAIPREKQTAQPKSESEGLEVKRQFGGQFAVLDSQGNALETFKTKQAAEEYVAAYDGVPA